MEESDEIHNTVALIKDWLNYLSGRYFSIEFQPQASVDNISEFPKDFKIFLKEVGLLYIGSVPERGSGYQVLIMDLPEPYHETELGYGYPQTKPDEEVAPNMLAKDIWVFARDVDFMLYGYLIRGGNYSFFCENEYGYGSFTEFLIEHINLHLGHLSGTGALSFQDFVKTKA